jgi:hypothetical protein
MTDAEWQATCDRLAGLEPPPDLGLGWDGEPGDDGDPGGEGFLTAELVAEARAASRQQAAAAARAARLGTSGALGAIGAALGRRGPGQPGSARAFPGEHPGPAGAFASGLAADTAPGCAVLAALADRAAGDGDRYRGASDDELTGVICAWDRVEAHAAARKLAAMAELLRRRPAVGCVPEGPAEMPAETDEFAADELVPALGESRRAVEGLLGLAHALEACLPGTRAALRAGIISVKKAQIVAAATALLDPAEAQAAESLVLGRAAALTPGGLRAAAAMAVMQVAADKARRRREAEAGQARVERWAEDSGNAGLAGRELPPAEVLAADQRVNAWADQLRKAGLVGGADQLRARAFLDLLLGVDSRPRPAAAAGDGKPDTDGSADPAADGTARAGDSTSAPGGAGEPGAGRGSDGEDGDAGGTGGPDAGGAGGGGSGPGPCGAPGAGPGAGPPAGLVPPGFAARVNLTVPLATLLGLAARPGELPGIGPVDPWLARDLAAAAAASPRSAWCVTVTDADGIPIGHGCARLPATARKPEMPATHGPPGGAGPPAGGAGFAFTRGDGRGPPGGYGTWRLSAGAPGRQDLIVALGPVATGDCDHRHQARGHDPGVLLRHLAQVRHATCTGPGCRRPAGRCEFEHTIPFEDGGRTCLCNGDPKCRHHHRMKQHPRWQAEHLSPGTLRWTVPSGRQYTTEPARYPI